MDHPMPSAVSGKPDDAVRGLLAAVLEALDIPAPATFGDHEAHDRILNDRAMHAKIALRSILEDGAPLGVDWTTTYLRERLGEHPPTGYQHHSSTRAEAGR